MKKVMVTGITGYIGQHCGAELLRQGYEVVGTVRSMEKAEIVREGIAKVCLLYTSPSPRDRQKSRMPSSA